VRPAAFTFSGRNEPRILDGLIWNDAGIKALSSAEYLLGGKAAATKSDGLMPLAARTAGVRSESALRSSAASIAPRAVSVTNPTAMFTSVSLLFPLDPLSATGPARLGLALVTALDDVDAGAVVGDKGVEVVLLPTLRVRLAQDGGGEVADLLQSTARAQIPCQGDEVQPEPSAPSRVVQAVIEVEAVHVDDQPLSHDDIPPGVVAGLD